MNFNQLTAAAAAAAAGNPANLNMSSFTTAVTNILANSNIDLSQLANLSQFSQNAALSAAVQQQQQQQQQHQPSSRQNLQQAHGHHRSSNSSSSALNSNSHLATSLSNSDAAAAAAAASIAAGLPTSISNLTSSALADFAAAAVQQQQQQTVAHSNRSSSIQSGGHHRSSGSSNFHHTSNHHSQLTAAHQSSSKHSIVGHNQSQNLHQQRHSNSTSSHNYNHNTLNSHSNITNNNNNLVNASSINSNNLNSKSNNIANNISLANNNSSNSNSNNNQTVCNGNIRYLAANNSSSVTPPKDSVCYRVGDCIYFESSPTLPSQIGRIDEIVKNGDNIEVKVVLFYRRRDIPSSLMTLADRYQYDETQEAEIEKMSEDNKHALKQIELFYSRVIETIPASAIRSKCSVQLLNESESLASYISKQDQYFYTLVYDPQQKTITADRGEIRVGSRYQAEVQPASVYKFQPGGDAADPRDLNDLETLVYTQDHDLSDDDINKYLTIAKSVGTFARALDCSSSIKQPSLHLTAASASRDITLSYAMQLLHQNDYDIGKAMLALVPSTGPILCRDEIEEWTAGEATLFEEAIEKYGRQFCDIRQDFLPWKSVKNIVEYYYMWKTTDRSINQRRMKALEAENKHTMLYISDPDHVIKKSPVPTESKATTITTSSSTTTTPSITNSQSNNSILSSDAAISADVKPNVTRPIKRCVDDSNQTTTAAPAVEPTSVATLKRRQVTEPKLSSQVTCLTTPGENLKFISTKRHKLMRKKLISRKELRHLSRRPWERRAKLRT